MLELTNHTDALVVPLLIAVAGATLMARKLEVHSIYSIRG
jgi:H+/Cl- antiporter ClcA